MFYQTQYFADMQWILFSTTESIDQERERDMTQCSTIVLLINWWFIDTGQDK